MKLVTEKQRQFLDNNTIANNGGTFGTIVTANKAATQAASVAADVATIVANFNTLLANLKAAGIVL